MDDTAATGPRILVLSLSASDPSVGRRCIPALQAALEAAGAKVVVRDIRDLPPVWVDKRKLEEYPPGYAELYSAVEQNDGVIMVFPIHCYTMSGPAKTLSEIVGDALEWKPVALVTAAGSHRSHLAARDLMASMTFEQWTICYPGTVQATEDMLLQRGGPGKELRQRLGHLATGFVAFARALKTFAEVRAAADVEE